MKPVRTLIVFGAGYLAGSKALRDPGDGQRKLAERLDEWARRKREQARTDAR